MHEYVLDMDLNNKDLFLTCLFIFVGRFPLCQYLSKWTENRTEKETLPCHYRLWSFPCLRMDSLFKLKVYMCYWFWPTHWISLFTCIILYTSLILCALKLRGCYFSVLNVISHLWRLWCPIKNSGRSLIRNKDGWEVRRV